jgi:6-phosphogluconolactonase
MSFLRTARAALVGLNCLRGTAFAMVLVLLAAFFVACGSGKLPAFQSGQNAYVSLPTQNSVLQLNINGLTGAVTTGAQTPQVLGTSPKGLALLSNKFLYVANSQANTISIFNVNSDGTLNLNGSPIPAGTGPDAAVIDPSGKYLLVSNSFSNNISVFSIDSGSGALSPVTGSPFFANDTPGEMLMLPAGNLVYVTNSRIGTVTGFAFDSATGVLTPVPRSPFVSGAGASGLAVDNSGRFLYVANTSAVNPGSVSTGNISGFNIDATTGTLSPISGSPFTSAVGSGPSAMVADPSGRFVFATTAGSSYSIWCFAIAPLTGQLTAEPGSPFSVAAGNLFAFIDATGPFLYIGSQSANGIEAYTYDPNNGQPTLIANSPFSTGIAPGKMVIAP